MSAEALLSRLERVRRTGPRRWIARCPAHEDRSPSLSIDEKDDGRTLVYCFAGCETADVLAAVGATWADVCPPRDRSAPGRKLRREPLAFASDALRVLAHEARFVWLCANDLARGKPLSEADRARLLVAAGRIARAERVCT